MDGMLDTQAIDVVRDTFYLILLISAPILAVGLVVGLVVSILQAVTQIQEQTLVFVPKILAMVATTVALFSWIAMQLMEFSAQMFAWSPVTGT
ncbi:MAG: flagellar biosynthesis protein FliQ [Planctomycetaceae bacterium]|nr:flagellar biosynthesis protein FliQ [Planctomycetaceae bacterium]